MFIYRACGKFQFAVAYIPHALYGSVVPAKAYRTIPMKAIWNNTVVAESDDTVVVEGNHYFPMDSLNREHVTFSNHKTTCAWKGSASYYSLLVNGELNADAAWYYPDPKPEAEEIKDRVVFWKGVKVEA